MKTRHFIATKIFSLILVLSLGAFAAHKIDKAINRIETKQENLQRQVAQLHVVDGHSSIPYKKYAGKFTATFYCPCEVCVGKKAKIRTATGNIPHHNKTIAVDSRVIPLHSIVYIKGLGFYVAEDTGGAVKGNKIDIYVNNHDEALKQGRKQVEVYILQ